MILLVPLALAYVCAVIYVAVILFISSYESRASYSRGCLCGIIYYKSLYITGLCAYYLRNYIKPPSLY